MKKEKIALVVGRFQPFHLGHLYLVKKALTSADKVIIAIGSSNITNDDNPMDFTSRKKMLEEVIKHEGWGQKVLKIVPSPDDPDDDIWLDLLLKNTGKFDVLIGNNDWVNGILKKAGYKVITIPYFQRDLYQGIHIRKLYKERGEWENRIPEYLKDSVREKLSGSA